MERKARYLMETNYADDEAPFRGDPLDPDEEPALGYRAKPGGGVELDPLRPGSDTAGKAGCTCPIMDNSRGDPALAKARGGYWMVETCSVHGFAEKA